MPSKTKATSQSTKESAREVQDSITTFSGTTAETLARTCEACAKGAVTMNAEVLSFMGTRLSRDIELGEAVSKCEDWADLFRVQQKWAQQATQDYITEAGKLAQLSAKLTQESWETVYQQTNQVLSEFNKPLS